MNKVNPIWKAPLQLIMLRGKIWREVYLLLLAFTIVLSAPAVANAGTWEEITKLTASDAAANDFFGVRVASSDDTIVVGANSNDDAGSSSGSVYVFDRNEGGVENWGEIAKLTAFINADER